MAETFIRVNRVIKFLSLQNKYLGMAPIFSARVRTILMASSFVLPLKILFSGHMSIMASVIKHTSSTSGGDININSSNPDFPRVLNLLAKSMGETAKINAYLILDHFRSLVTPILKQNYHLHGFANNLAAQKNKLGYTSH